MKRVSIAMMVATLMLVAASPAWAGEIKLSRIVYDPPGTDRSRERVVIVNTGDTPVAMEGWTLRDLDGHVFTFPKYKLRAEGAVRIHTGFGHDTRSSLFWGSASAVWDNDGDAAHLFRPVLVRPLADRCRYAGGARVAECR